MTTRKKLAIGAAIAVLAGAAYLAQRDAGDPLTAPARNCDAAAGDCAAFEMQVRVPSKLARVYIAGSGGTVPADYADTMDEHVTLVCQGIVSKSQVGDLTAGQIEGWIAQQVEQDPRLGTLVEHWRPVLHSFTRLTQAGDLWDASLLLACRAPEDATTRTVPIALWGEVTKVLRDDQGNPAGTRSWTDHHACHPLADCTCDGACCVRCPAYGQPTTAAVCAERWARVCGEGP